MVTLDKCRHTVTSAPSVALSGTLLGTTAEENQSTGHLTFGINTPGQKRHRSPGSKLAVYVFVPLCSVTSGSLWPYQLQAAKLLCLWDSRGKNTGVHYRFLLQGIFQTQGWNWVSWLSISQNYLQWTRQERTWEVQPHRVSGRETKPTGGKVSEGGEGSNLCFWEQNKDSDKSRTEDKCGLWSDHCDILKGELEKLSVLFSSVSQSRPTLCNLMDCSTPGLPVHYQLPEFTQTHAHWVGDAIQPSHPLLSSFPPTFSLSHHKGLFKWVSSSHQVAKVLEFQLQHQFFQWIFRTDFL